MVAATTTDTHKSCEKDAPIDALLPRTGIASSTARHPERRQQGVLMSLQMEAGMDSSEKTHLHDALGCVSGEVRNIGGMMKDTHDPVTTKTANYGHRSS